MTTPPPLDLGPPEGMNKAWRSTGFYDQDENTRPVIDVGREKLMLPVQ
jgi:hypothetical protein